MKDYEGNMYDRETLEMIPNLSGDRSEISVIRDTGDWSMGQPAHAVIPSDVFDYLVSSGNDQDKIFRPWFGGDEEEAEEETRAEMLAKGLVFDLEIAKISTDVWCFELDLWTSVRPICINVPDDCYEYITRSGPKRHQFDELADVEGDAVAKDALIAEVRQQMADDPNI